MEGIIAVIIVAAIAVMLKAEENSNGSKCMRFRAYTSAIGSCMPLSAGGSL